MALTEKQIGQYREKLKDSVYMESAINSVADKISKEITSVNIPDVKPKINITEGTMKNKAIDLHNILFEQLERLNDLDDDEMKSEKLVNEIRRAETINKVSAQLINNGRLVLDGMKYSDEAPKNVEMPEMFSVSTLPAPKQDGKK